MAALFFFVFMLFIISISISMSRRVWREKKRLPRGTMGWMPIVGETLQYARPNSTLTAGSFINSRITRYGKVFKSHLFGEAIIVCTDAKLNQLILQKEGSLFKSSYPGSLLNLIGHQNTTEIHGEVHKAVRSAVLSVVGGRVRTPKTFHFISAQVLNKLCSWNGRVVYFQEEASQMSFSLVINQLMSISADQPVAKYLYHNFETLVDGLLRVPIDLPTTGYNRAMKAKKNVIKVIENIIDDKRVNPNMEAIDVLDGILAAQESKGSMITHNVVIDVMVGIIFAAYETTSSIFTFVVKFLADHQKVLAALQEEHYNILEQMQRENNTQLSWEYYKLMSFTHNVVKETLRLANAGDVVFREALQDVDIDGFTIPKGWKILLSFIPAHLDPTNFHDPLAFNPWRWQDRPSDGCFMPFGGGMRQCAGQELAKLEVSIFIHHLVTSYRWEQVEEDKFVRSRGLRFQKGLPIYFKELKVE